VRRSAGIICPRACAARTNVGQSGHTGLLRHALQQGFVSVCKDRSGMLFLACAGTDPACWFCMCRSRSGMLFLARAGADPACWFDALLGWSAEHMSSCSACMLAS
jgi:hypothetical protein